MSAHAAYILAAYAFTALVVGGLILWAVLRYRAESRTLRALEARLGRE